MILKINSIYWNTYTLDYCWEVLHFQENSVCTALNGRDIRVISNYILMKTGQSFSEAIYESLIATLDAQKHTQSHLNTKKKLMVAILLLKKLQFTLKIQ